MILNSFRSKEEKSRQMPKFEAKQDVNAEEDKNEEEQEIKTSINIQDQPSNSYFSSEFYDEDKKYFQKASSSHALPMNNIERCIELKSNPDIFAVYASAPKSIFKEMNLKELMSLDDYKKLTQLRIRNYISIIKMLYQAYYFSPKKEQKYPIFRKKLL